MSLIILVFLQVMQYPFNSCIESGSGQQRSRLNPTRLPHNLQLFGLGFRASAPGSKERRSSSHAPQHYWKGALWRSLAGKFFVGFECPVFKWLLYYHLKTGHKRVQFSNVSGFWMVTVMQK